MLAVLSILVLISDWEIVAKRSISKGPPFITDDRLTVVTGQGEEAKLVCPIEGTPQPIIEWSKVRDNVSFLISHFI